jgi:hypothetical protein
MTRLGFALRALLLGVAVALPVSADAPKSGPDKQYDDFVEGDDYITDRFTKLVWDRSVPTARSFDLAKTYCANAGMRLPSLKELLTLVDEEPHLEYEVNQNVLKTIDQSAFPKTPEGPFWTSSVKGQNEVWAVNFRTGETKSADTALDQRRFRCVDVP